MPASLTKALTVLLFASYGLAQQCDGPTEPDIAKNCIKYICGFEGDDCTYLSSLAGISKDQFQKLNPALAKDCKAVKEGWRYCTVTSDSSSSGGDGGGSTGGGSTGGGSTGGGNTGGDSGAGSSGVITSKPVQVPDGQPQTCSAWYQVKGGDNCRTIIDKFATDFNFKLVESHFLAFNPTLNPDCSGLTQGMNLCIKAGPIPWASHSTAPGGDGSSGGPSGGSTNANGVITTKPAQVAPGQPQTCSAWYQVKGGDNCRAIVDKLAKDNDIKLAESHFLAFNPALGPDCSGLAQGIYLCIKAGPIPTPKR
ncbi:hypothetical protein ABW21_db0209227 [Orbilia brochopaga]|nr:hypothetical protein ABW21_db0209227 [Drechslerella brochopaga]